MVVKIQDHLEAALDEGKTWRIRSTSDYLYEVIVTFHACEHWSKDMFLQQVETKWVLCLHATTVINCSSQYISHNLMDYIGPYFFSRFCCRADTPFGRPNTSLSEIGILSLTTKKMPSRPKKMRIPLRGKNL